MLNELISLDKELLLWFNSYHTPFLDNFIFILSGKLMWVPAALVLIYLVVKQYKSSAWFVLLFLVLAIVLSDQISSSIIKPLVERYRPPRDLEIGSLVQTVHGYRGGRYGFVSSHAANWCAVSLFTSLLFKNRLYAVTISLVTVLICYTRMYLGVHFPLDILFGGALGLLLGYVCFGVMRLNLPRLPVSGEQRLGSGDSLLFLVVVLLSIGVVAVGHDVLLVLA